MAYRKISAEKIFTGMVTEEGLTLVTSSNGRIIDLLKTEDAGDDIEMLEGMLCPGFVNAHCHTELSHMQAIVPENTGMVPFLMKVMFERQADERRKQEATEHAIATMQANGIVGVGDICNTADSLPSKTAANSLYFHNFIETSGFVPSGATMRFEQALTVQQQFGAHFAAKQISITPHAPYSVSGKMFELIALQQPQLISIHNQESVAEDEFIRNRAGNMLQLYKAIGANIDYFEPQHTSSLQYMLPLFPINAQVILVHNCHTKAADIEAIHLQAAISNNSYYWCVCPNANLYISNPLPDIALLQQSNLPICIGTDSLASNHQLSILSEMQTLQLHIPNLTIETLLQWATLNGANAIKAADQLGSFEKGKKPGILLLQNLQENNLATATLTKLV
jgi:cytosine/adenosine deaminase-related metal-dependent hydrolase